MIYLDNAATTWPKPPGVVRAMTEVLEKNGASPGRGSHWMSISAGRMVFQVRERLAALFGVRDSSRLVFTLNCTEALNLALKGLLQPGDHVVTSSMEHNSVIRPLHALGSCGISYTAVQCGQDGTLDPALLEQAIRPETRLMVLTHASNIAGTLLPVAEAVEIAGRHKIKFMLDAAQTAGVFPIDVQQLPVDLMAFPGHKGLYGPTGTGGLYVREGIELEPLRYGGTGSHSESVEQPRAMPEGLESGTVNAVGIAGLGAGVEFVLEQGIEEIHNREALLWQRLHDGLTGIPGIRIYGNEHVPHAPTLAVNLKEHDSGEVAFLLDRMYKIEVRAGLHCAAMAHRTLGTSSQGAVRFSFSYFNTEEEVDQTVTAMKEIAAELG